MEKRTTIYDIAKRLGISTATVNRALTGKPRVKEETRRLVVETAAEMGFKPNLLARSLARRPLKLAVMAFTSFPEFHDPFLQGARSAAESLVDYNVHVDCFGYDEGASNTPEADQFLEDSLKKIALDGYDGALVLARNAQAFHDLKERGIYVATAVNDIEEELRGFHICYNGFIAGRMAAELVFRWTPDKGRPVAVASGWKGMGIHEKTAQGFLSQAQHLGLDVCAVYYNHDNKNIAYESTCQLLQLRPDLGAIYVNSFNCVGVIRAVVEAGRAGELLLITSDISEELRAYFDRGIVAASIFQNQYEQGRRGLRTLFEALSGSSVEKLITIDPQIILQSNLELFFN